jgi:predicted lipoprotein with Yx(FWY)xxD motif
LAVAGRREGTSERGISHSDDQRPIYGETMKTHRIVLVAAALGALTLTGSALGQSAHSSAATVVTTKTTSLGTILVTSSGQTLYLDSADKPGHPSCTGGCLSIWPALKASGTPKASGSAKASLLGTTKIAGGIKQVTYNGHQLYTFASDTKSKPTSGEGVNGFYVVSPSGTKVTKPSTTKKKPPSTTPGY